MGGTVAFLIVSSAALLAAIVFIESPSAAYFSSGEADFPLPLIAYFTPLVMCSLAFVIAMALLSYILPRKARLVLAAFTVFVTAVALAETMFLLPDFGAFTGQATDFTVSWGSYGAEVAVVIAAAAIAFLFVREPQFWSTICITASLAIAAPPLWSAMTEDKIMPLEVDEEEVFLLGETNLLVVLLDGFPSDVFEQIIEEDPAWGDRLSGFTYYPDTVGVSTTTFVALPSIHSGSTFSPDAPLQPFFTDAIRERSFLTMLSSAGYSSLLVNPMNGVCPEGVSCVGAASLLESTSQIRSAGAARLLGVSLFKAAPLAAKEVFYDGGAFLLPQLVSDQRVTDHNIEGVETVSLFAEKLREGGDRPTAKFVHVLTPHLPVVFREDCTYAGNPIPATREAFVAQSRCALTAFGSIVDSLKEKGLYDDTAIILLSDHGQAIPSRKADQEGDWKKLSGWGNPLLAVKPRNTAGLLSISPDPRWLPEVPSIACEATGGCEVPTVEGTRVFNYYEWRNEYWGADRLPVTQYEVPGPPWEAGSWMER